MASGHDDMVLDPERHLKRLRKVVGVSKRIKELADSKSQYFTAADDKAKDAEALEEARDKRRQRINSLELVHSNILTVIAKMLNISLEEAQEGMADSDRHIQLIKNLTEAKGRKAVLFTYDLYDQPPKGGFSIRNIFVTAPEFEVIPFFFCFF